MSNSDEKQALPANAKETKQAAPSPLDTLRQLQEMPGGELREVAADDIAHPPLPRQGASQPSANISAHIIPFSSSRRFYQTEQGGEPDKFGKRCGQGINVVNMALPMTWIWALRGEEGSSQIASLMGGGAAVLVGLNTFSLIVSLFYNGLLTRNDAWELTCSIKSLKHNTNCWTIINKKIRIKLHKLARNSLYLTVAPLLTASWAVTFADLATGHMKRFCIQQTDSSVANGFHSGIEHAGRYLLEDGTSTVEGVDINQIAFWVAASSAFIMLWAPIIPRMLAARIQAMLTLISCHILRKNFPNNATAMMAPLFQQENIEAVFGKYLTQAQHRYLGELVPPQEPHNTQEATAPHSDDAQTLSTPLTSTRDLEHAADPLDELDSHNAKPPALMTNENEPTTKIDMAKALSCLLDVREEVEGKPGAIYPPVKRYACEQAMNIPPNFIELLTVAGFVTAIIFEIGSLPDYLGSDDLAVVIAAIAGLLTMSIIGQWAQGPASVYSDTIRSCNSASRKTPENDNIHFRSWLSRLTARTTCTVATFSILALGTSGAGISNVFSVFLEPGKPIPPIGLVAIGLTAVSISSFNMIGFVKAKIKCLQWKAHSHNDQFYSSRKNDHDELVTLQSLYEYLRTTNFDPNTQTREHNLKHEIGLSDPTRMVQKKGADFLMYLILSGTSLALTATQVITFGEELAAGNIPGTNATGLNATTFNVSCTTQSYIDEISSEPTFVTTPESLFDSIKNPRFLPVVIGFATLYRFLSLAIDNCEKPNRDDCIRPCTRTTCSLFLNTLPFAARTSVTLACYYATMVIGSNGGFGNKPQPVLLARLNAGVAFSFLLGIATDRRSTGPYRPCCNVQPTQTQQDRELRQPLHDQTVKLQNGNNYVNGLAANTIAQQADEEEQKHDFPTVGTGMSLTG